MLEPRKLPHAWDVPNPGCGREVHGGMDFKNGATTFSVGRERRRTLEDLPAQKRTGLGLWLPEGFEGVGRGSVSYTHLTLPTICSV